MRFCCLLEEHATLKLSLYFAGPDLDQVLAQDRQVVAIEKRVVSDGFGRHEVLISVYGLTTITLW